VLALAFIVGLGHWACQPTGDEASAVHSTPTPENPTNDGELHVVEFFDEKTPEGVLVRKVRKIEARTGDRVKFTAHNRTMWVLIPRKKIEKVSGGADWAKGDSFIAFKIENAGEMNQGDADNKGSATVLIRSDYKVPGEEDSFAYSIIEFEAPDWRYDHDESPPRMIIRKR